MGWGEIEVGRQAGVLVGRQTDFKLGYVRFGREREIKWRDIYTER